MKKIFILQLLLCSSVVFPSQQLCFSNAQYAINGTDSDECIVTIQYLFNDKNEMVSSSVIQKVNCDNFSNISTQPGNIVKINWENGQVDSTANISVHLSQYEKAHRLPKRVGLIESRSIPKNPIKPCDFKLEQTKVSYLLLFDNSALTADISDRGYQYRILE